MQGLLTEIGASVLAGVIAVCVTVFFIKIHAELQEKRQRKERLCSCRQQLRKVSSRFRDDCTAAVSVLFSQYTAYLLSGRYHREYNRIISDYRKEIAVLKNDYLVNYALKYSNGDNGLRAEAEDFPIDILDEYRMEISDIAVIFHDLSDCIAEQLDHIKTYKL